MEENILIVEDEFIVANDLKFLLTQAGYHVCGIAASVPAARAMLERFDPTWVLLDIFLKGTSLGIEFGAYLGSKGIGFIYISANTNQSVLEQAKATQPSGFLVKPFREKDLIIMLDIARRKHRENLQLIAERKELLQSHLCRIARHTVLMEDRLRMLPPVFIGLIPFDFIKIYKSGHHHSAGNIYGFARLGFDDYTFLKGPELYTRLGISTRHSSEYLQHTEQGSDGYLNGMEYSETLLSNEGEKILSTCFALKSKLFFYYEFSDGSKVGITFYSQQNQIYNVHHLNLFKSLDVEVRSVFDLKGVVPLKDQLDSSTLSRPTPGQDPFAGIVGNSPALLKVLDNINLVASASLSVLILGESGTGKEQVAQAIHQKSDRRGKPLIVVNCAALPSELIESILFGYEKGAFTGAVERRVGKFEAAHEGTIFLDEIGELPLEAQVKLLRVLQEHEFERVGSSKTIRVDVRVIAATNRNLEKEVAQGRLRLDLYYRLNVFPIELPPLRSRKEDILLLSTHFIKKSAEKAGRVVPGISEVALHQLMEYNWPGNIRELEHLIERTLLTTPGTTVSQFEMPLQVSSTSKLVTTDVPEKTCSLKTLSQIEYDYILRVLRECGGRISGPGGAAEVLGLPPSTLYAKLKKLGITREFSIE